MLKSVLPCMAIAIIIVACGPAKKGLFAEKKTEHEKYSDRIREAGLDKTTMGRQWFAAAVKGLAQPLNITSPYKENGYLAADKPAAAGYIFSARRGDRITVTISVVPDTLPLLFGELWKPGADVSDVTHLASIDSNRTIVHDAEEDGSFVFRLQAPLLETVEYTLTISTGPSLAFPVSEEGNPKLISFWSDPRDGGRRSHQGVDISARFRTPAIAAANGRVNRVMENRLGGKVVFMRPEGKDYSLYYAHLDSQIVSAGDEVKVGQVLGLVGNTGNAKGTVPHLHFGIYTFGGAIDPLPFVDPRRKTPAEITAPVENLGSWLSINANTRLTGLPAPMNDSLLEIRKGSAVRVIGAADNYYKVQLPGGTEGYIQSTHATARALDVNDADSSVRILNQPSPNAAAITSLAAGTRYELIGRLGNYNLIRSGKVVGWISD